ncbi:MAG TPA: IPT/TIG domain-containing protein [Candidatus Dormibacteraeota bacterium]|nr:IPT/TIG domain-containing protein [Candidatus Dormibacteraeota bacterium]
MSSQRKLSRGPLRMVWILLLLAGSSAVSGYGQTAQEKASAFAAIKAKWQSLPGVDRDADNAELLAFLRARPEFSDSGIVAGSSTVWAKFNDGRVLILANNFELGPPDPAAPSEIPFRLPSPEAQANSKSPAHSVFSSPSELLAPLAVAQELPKTRQARLMHPIRNWPTAVPNIRQWLIDAGYDVVDDPGTLTSLRTLADDGILYMEAHGGQARVTPTDPGTKFAVWTADEYDVFEDSDAKLKEDLDLGRVLYMGGNELSDPVTRELVPVFHYGITDKFVTEYWKFGANSLAYFTVCQSDGGGIGVQDFKNAVLAKGASVYAGWSQSVRTNIALRTAKLVFDRLLGANDPNAFPEQYFKQRPFEWLSIGGDPLQSDLAQHSLGIDITTGALLSFTPNSIAGLGDFGLLAPSIMLMSPIEVDLPFTPFTAGTLQITGAFGSDPRPDPDSKVTVGGLDCPVKPNGWTPDLILCDMPSGAAGDVVVTVRKHQSNKARLTKWDGTFAYAIEGDGSLKATITYHALFRPDVRKVRTVIHLPPIGPFFTTATLTDESTASYACSGSAVSTVGSTTTTITWTGAGNVPASRVLPPSANSFQMGLNGIPGPTVQVTTDHGPEPGCDWTSVLVTPDGTYTQTGHWRLKGPEFDIGVMPIEPSDPSFPGGSKSDFPFCDAPQTFTPARCRVDWGPIPAAFRPDPNSAR